MMEDGFINMEETNGVSFNRTGVRSSSRCLHSAVTVCLGLLSVFLLVGLFTLCVHYNDLRAEFSVFRDNLTERLQDSDDKLSSMTEDRARLTADLTAKTEELDRLKQQKTCPSGWTLFGDTCYLVSSKSGSWDEGREDCRGRGADLVVIDRPEEQTFLSSFTTEPSWIGLSDKDEEHTWKWVDGTPLTLMYWTRNQPDNGNGELGEEDCAHIRSQGVTTWNDLSCTSQLKWVCEL